MCPTPCAMSRRHETRVLAVSALPHFLLVVAPRLFVCRSAPCIGTGIVIIAALVAAVAANVTMMCIDDLRLPCSLLGSKKGGLASSSFLALGVQDLVGATNADASQLKLAVYAHQQSPFWDAGADGLVIVAGCAIEWTSQINSAHKELTTPASCLLAQHAVHALNYVEGN